MKPAHSPSSAPSVPGGIIALILLPVAAAAGFLAGNSLVALIAVASSLVTLFLFLSIRLSTAVKLMFLLVAVTFLQRAFGYFKIGDVRGLNVLNLLLLATISYWIIHGLRRGSLYRATPLDFWLAVATMVIPPLSILYTLTFRNVPGYSLGAEISWYKQWVTPFIYFFLLCQCLETKRDIRLLFWLTLVLVGLAVLEGVPEALQFTYWRESRSAGIVGQANYYAALLATMSPFLFLVLFLLRERPVVRLLALGMLGLMAVSILTTYSRAGYIGFALAFLGSLYAAHRSRGIQQLTGPAILIAAVSLFPLVAVPQVLESLRTRFQPETYLRAKRKSYDRYRRIDQYSGGRIGIWKGALRMAREHPLTGVGFHAFERELPRYHDQGWANYPHNQYLGTLAEGGIVWLLALLVFFWRVLQFLYQNWRYTLRSSDLEGQLICGGALVAFLVLLCLNLAGDFLAPGPMSTIFWVVMAGAIRYGMVTRAETPAT